MTEEIRAVYKAAQADSPELLNISIGRAIIKLKIFRDDPENNVEDLIGYVLREFDMDDLEKVLNPEELKEYKAV